MPRRPITAVCFVCTGNICRSPIAEQVLRTRIADAGLARAVTVESAGTDAFHVGEAADPRAAAALAAAGYPPHTHRARRFEPSWFGRFDHVVALDTGHARRLRRLASGPGEVRSVSLLRSWDAAAADDGESDVPDPYYGGRDGFADVLRMVEPACDGLLAHLRAAIDARADLPREATA